MPVLCTFCQKNYSEKAARCPFCNTPGAHAPPPVAPQPALTPAAAAAAQDPELKKRMMLAAVQMKSDYPTEYAHTEKFSLQNIPVSTRAAVVMWVMAALSFVFGAIILTIPAREFGKNALEFKIMGLAGLISSLILGGLGYGAFRGILLCVWIGAGLYFVDFVFMITHGAVPGAMIKLMVLVALLKFGWQMKEEQD